MSNTDDAECALYSLNIQDKHAAVARGHGRPPHRPTEATISPKRVTVLICLAPTWSTRALPYSIQGQQRLPGRRLHISAGVSLKHTAGGSYTRPLRGAEVCLAGCSAAVEGGDEHNWNENTASYSIKYLSDT